MSQDNFEEVKNDRLYWSEVFEKYVERYPFATNFLNLDGIVNKSLWNASLVKILCYFKEAYRSDKNEYQRHYFYPLIKELNDCKTWGVWLKVRAWVDCILAQLGYSAQVNSLQTIAVADIIKSINSEQSGKNVGNSKTSKKRLVENFERDFDLLLQQYNSIQPNIIIWGAGNNTINLLSKLLKVDVENTDYYSQYTTNKKLYLYLPKKKDWPTIFHPYHPASYHKNQTTTANDFAQLLSDEVINSIKSNL